MQTAERFLVTEETILSWLRRLDEEGESGLVRAEEPVNKFPDMVAHLVRRLTVTCPALGKAKIAQVGPGRLAPRRQHGRPDAEARPIDGRCRRGASRRGNALREGTGAERRLARRSHDGPDSGRVLGALVPIRDVPPLALRLVGCRRRRQRVDRKSVV